MQVVYDLATDKNGSAAWLENTIVILEPCVNPDGYNRYSNWNNQVSTSPYNASADAREHDEPWPGGRTNHYLFDLNRDWAWQTQVESRNRIAAYRRWMPHVVADLHEMSYSSPYYFAPAAQPYHEFITEWQRNFQVAIGKNHAKYFDREGWAYFTKEVFDLFYPSYGDTYPVYSGAIGMTYEQGGHGFAGRAISLPNNDTLWLADRIAHHVTTSLSTIEITSLNAQDVIRQFREYFKRSLTNPPGIYKTYIVKGTNSSGRLTALTQLLDLQGIIYGKAANGQYKGAFDYSSGTQQDITLGEDDVVISAYQPQAVLTQILFDPESKLVDSLTYDITCWSLPFAYGLEAYALKVKVEVIYTDQTPVQTPSADPTAYAYALRWKSLADGKFLAAALKAGLQARFTEKEFVVDNQSFDPGTVLFMRTDHRNNSHFPEALIELSQTFNTPLYNLKTGFVSSGRDLGSSSYQLIETPRVLTFAGDGVSPNEFGQVWHFFEQELHYPLTVVNLEDLGSVTWNDYNLLVMPEGYYSISEGTLKTISDWVRSGGKVIAIGSALAQFRDKEGFALKRYAESTTEEEVKKAEEKDRLHLRLEQYGSDERRSISGHIPGAVFKAHVDPTHPLGFGLGKYYYTLKTGSTSYEHLLDADNAVYLTDELKYYGFVGYRAREKQKNSVIFAMEHKGAGAIIYLVDNPLFRAFWENGKFAFCNALFFAGN
jgi:hypothetical protein